MAISLKHSKNVAKADGVDSTVVQPSDWNAEHTFTAAAGKVLGTLVGSTTVSELSLEIDATGQSIKFPSGTTANRPSAPAAGMVRYNTTTAFLEAYLNSAWSTVDAFPSGTKMLFQQTAAPTGWTKDTTHDNKALRVVSGAAGSGGSVAFTTAFSNQSVSSTTATGTVGDTTLTINQIPAHTHAITWLYQSPEGGSGDVASYLAGTGSSSNTGSAGGGQSHTHSFTGSAHSHTINLAVQYVDLIIATKN